MSAKLRPSTECSKRYVLLNRLIAGSFLKQSTLSILVWLLRRSSLRGLAPQRVAAVPPEGPNPANRGPARAGLVLHQRNAALRPQRPAEQHSVHGECEPSQYFKPQINSSSNLQGCIYKMADDLKHHLILLGAIGLGICVIQVFGMILSCCLYVKLKNVLD